MKKLFLVLLLASCAHSTPSPEAPMTCKLEGKAAQPCSGYWKEPEYATKVCVVETWVCAPSGYSDRKIIEFHWWQRPEK